MNRPLSPQDGAPPPTLAERTISADLREMIPAVRRVRRSDVDFEPWRLANLMSNAAAGLEHAVREIAALRAPARSEGSATPQQEGAAGNEEERTYTSRGFAVYGEVEDLHGVQVVVSQSSLATEDAVRIYVHDPDPDPACAHLTVGQAAAVRDALTDFLRHVEAAPATPQERPELRERIAFEVWAGMAYPDARDTPITRRIWEDMRHTRDTFIVCAYATADRLAALLGGEERSRTEALMILREYGDDCAEAGTNEWPNESEVLDRLARLLSPGENEGTQP